MKFNIPLGVNIDNDKMTEAYTNTQGSVTSDGLNIGSASGIGNKINVYLNPDFSMPLDLGPFNKIKVGA